eukprot:scaffold45934_cov421-Isochrysis_galbana.AAC.1
MSLPSPIVGREAVKFAAHMLRDGICGAQGRAEACVCGLVGGEHGEHGLSSKETNASLRWHGCEELVRLGHDQHLGGGAVEVVEMERSRPTWVALAAREAIERVAE